MAVTQPHVFVKAVLPYCYYNTNTDSEQYSVTDTICYTNRNLSA